jgi:hypothetical protein
MSVTINASTSSGLIQTADTSGELALQSNGTTKLTVASTGVAITGASLTSFAGGAITSGTAVASTSGTSIDFTSIPSWVKRVTVMFSGVSTNGSSLQIVQLGTSGGVQTTGYAGTATTNGANSSSTVGILVGYRGDAANVYSGAIVCTLLNSATGLWVAQGVNSGAGGTTGDASMIGATKTLSGTLDRVRITTTNGTDTFDAGTINILYEG